MPGLYILRLGGLNHSFIQQKRIKYWLRDILVNKILKKDKYFALVVLTIYGVRQPINTC